ncbi:MAG: thymidine phosphorylase [Gemmataceae bacterium]|nr:thymidine phosphorylase [Gemmataceae bacterium]
MRAVDIIRNKRDGGALSPAEIEAFVAGVTGGSWPDYQAAALLMAIVLRGMTAEETAHLTHAMVHSGVRLDLADLPGPKVDKHSTGGVGDSTSLILAPLAACCGVVVPMMSGRGLGHSGGTLDKLESIPGFRTALPLDEFRSALAAVGCALIGQTREIAPADRKLYALRDVTATVESIPLITASILSKKVAEGINALVMDVKCGRGAFMKTPVDARRLAESLVRTGNANGVKTTALVTAMDVPLGRAVGNSLEMIESLETLKGKGPADLEGLSVALAARMVHAGGRAVSLEDAERQVRAALTSGRGLEKVRQIVERQGGDPRVIDDYSRLYLAPQQTLVRAERPGYVVHLDAELIGRASMLLGAGRDRAEDPIDHAVGVIVQAACGEQVRAGDAVLEVHHRGEARLPAALELLRRGVVIGDAPPPEQPQILETMG